MTPEREKRYNDVIHHRQPGLSVVLENVFDPHNISAVMRSCDAVGIQDIYVLNTRIPRHKKWGRRSSSSAAKWLSVHEFENTADCFSVLRKNFEKIYTTHLSADAVSMYDIDFTGRIALVFGNEHDGVSDESRALADGNFIIPQVGMIRSLNISVACAVTIYEAFRQKSVAGQYDVPQLPLSRQEELFMHWSVPGVNND
jgi:tRNA (guanosine-2'-O-)-methyltransferase